MQTESNSETTKENVYLTTGALSSNQRAPQGLAPTPKSVVRLIQRFEIHSEAPSPNGETEPSRVGAACAADVTQENEERDVTMSAAQPSVDNRNGQDGNGRPRGSQNDALPEKSSSAEKVRERPSEDDRNAVPP